MESTFLSFYFSELTEKLDLAKSITKEAVQVSQTIFLENNWKVDNSDQWFDNVSSFLLFPLLYESLQKMGFE